MVKLLIWIKWRVILFLFCITDYFVIVMLSQYRQEAEIAAQFVCKQIRTGSTDLYKRWPYALDITLNPTDTC